MNHLVVVVVVVVVVVPSPLPARPLPPVASLRHHPATTEPIAVILCFPISFHFFKIF